MVKVDGGNRYHYLVMIEYLTYDDGVFCKKSDLLYEIFAMKKTRADEFLII